MGNVVRIEGYEFELEWLHFGVMGKAGTGKSHLIASMPKPLKVFATDPMTKLQPYFDQGVVDPKVHVGKLGEDIRIVKDREGKVIIQIHGFYDKETTLKNAGMTKLVTAAAELPGEVDAGMWKSFGLDSWSGFEDLARYRRLVPDQPFHVKNADGRAHHNIAKEDCKSVFLHNLIHLNCNVGIAFHTTRFAQENGGEVTYNVKCIGDFSQTISQNLTERYHSVALPGGRRQLHTQPDGRFELNTSVDAPDPCDNTFGALLSNKIKKLLAEAKAAGKPQTV